MRQSDLKRGTVYALNHGYSRHVDVRHAEEIARVEYVGPEAPVYDRYRPTRKTNAGQIVVKLLSEGKYIKGAARKTGDTFSVTAADLVCTWDDLIEARGATQRAIDAKEQYLSNLKHLLAEVDPHVILNDEDHWYSRRQREGTLERTIDITLRTTNNETEFDVESSTVSMPVELFRKLLSGMKIG